MPASSIAVLGGTGFVGRALLSDTGKWRSAPRVLVHRSRPEWLTGTAAVEVDLESEASLRDALRGCEVLINLLRPDGSGWYPALMRRLIRLIADAGVRRIVHTSSIDVYNGSDARVVDVSTPPSPRTPYETEHVEVENLVMSSRVTATILRLGAVFGPGGKNVVAFANEMAVAPRWKLALRRSLYGNRRMHLVSVGSVCDALLFCAQDAAADQSRVLVVTEDGFEENNFAFVQNTLARAFGRPPLTGVPVLPPAVLAGVLRARGLSPLVARRRFSPASMDALGLRPRSFPDELESYARHLAADVRGARP